VARAGESMGTEFDMILAVVSTPDASTAGIVHPHTRFGGAKTRGADSRPEARMWLWSAGGPWQTALAFLIAAAACMLGGCAGTPAVLPADQQHTIDRAVTEYPAGTELQRYVVNLTAPTAICFDNNGWLIVAEGGFNGHEPAVFGFKRDGTRFDIYPYGRRIPFIHTGFTIHGPIGGIFAHRGKIYVSHRDDDDRGVITAFGYDGSHTTIVADLPAEGDYGITDMAINPNNGRLYFGVGSATNSGVVGLDNWAEGWVQKHRDFCDKPYQNLRLLGYRLETPNPEASPLLGISTITVTSPFQPWNISNRTKIPAASDHSPTGAIYSVADTGGDKQVEAWGVRYPRGLSFDEFGNLYFTDEGMELRGTRPIENDPDVLYRLVPGAWYGFPDYSRDCRAISDSIFQPDESMILPTGYDAVSFVIDHAASGLVAPDPHALLAAKFGALAGAAKIEFISGSGLLRNFRDSAIVALAGDRGPFATSGQALNEPPTGYRLVLVDPDKGTVSEFIHNTRYEPASRLPGDFADGVERPVDVKFGPDGALYVLDFGKMDMKNGHYRIKSGSGRIYRLVAAPDDEQK
jgi:glucose/arabinose dehydrogenase